MTLPERMEALFKWRWPKPIIHNNEWGRQRYAFERLLEIGTPEALFAAGLMCVPEGWIITFLSELGLAGGCACHLGNPGTGAESNSDNGQRTFVEALADALWQIKEMEQC